MRDSDRPIFYLVIVSSSAARVDAGPVGLSEHEEAQFVLGQVDPDLPGVHQN